MLGDYDGTMIIVSHDRDFLDHLVTSIIYMRGNGNIEEYVGSYSDALEKISPQSVKAKAVSKAKPEAARPKMINSRKLSYNQQRLLEILPSQIEEIERKIKEVTLKLADTELYQKDREQFFALSEELKELENQKSEAENQWLEISIIAEEPV